MTTGILLLCICGSRRNGTASKGAFGGDVTRLATRPVLGWLMARSDLMIWSKAVKTETSQLS
jgi:hypothetical protein